MNESSLELCNKPGKVIATKRPKYGHFLTCVKKGKTISIVVCYKAESNFLSPCGIYCGKKKKKYFDDNVPPE